uniref:FBA_2 domain-containing protein n=1 Tax=Steinernema glaseri TaxID=37863 RepID=A0A1I7YPM8_9BILA
MDRVPFAFYDHLRSITYFYELWTTKELSGYYGEISHFAFKHRAEYSVDVADGIEKHGYLSYDCGDQEVREPEEIEAFPKKFVHTVTINLKDAKDENVSRAIVRRFPYSYYDFVHHSSSINEAWVDLAYSLKRLETVTITEELDDDALRLFRKLVTGQKLTWLAMHVEACNDSTMDIFKTLLCQDQFQELDIVNEITEWDDVDICEILEFWSENNEKLRGKALVLQDKRKTSTLPGNQFDIENALTPCSKEECHFIKTEYNGNLFTFEKPSCFYKFEEVDEGNERRFYISFECAHEETHDEGGGSNDRATWQQLVHPSFFGLKGLSLMRKTMCLQVLFG